jgi:hypothetical protein
MWSLLSGAVTGFLSKAEGRTNGAKLCKRPITTIDSVFNFPDGLPCRLHRLTIC